MTLRVFDVPASGSVDIPPIAELTINHTFTTNAFETITFDFLGTGNAFEIPNYAGSLLTVGLQVNATLPGTDQIVWGTYNTPPTVGTSSETTSYFALGGDPANPNGTFSTFEVDDFAIRIRATPSRPPTP